MISNPHIPEEYKLTKVGVVPRDWCEYSISDLLVYSKKPITMKNKDKYKLITVKRNFGGIVPRGSFYGDSVLVKTQFLVESDDFIISKRQISHGACGILPKDLNNAIVSNEYNVFKNSKYIDITFFNYFVQLPRIKRLFYLMSDGVHIEKLLFKTESWLKRKIAIPQLKEQQKIAKVLITQDKIIKLKEKLLEEKKKQKKYLMQVLLNPDSEHFKRLDGFCGEWEEIKLKDIGYTYGGLNGKTKDDFGQGKPYIAYMNIFSNPIIYDEKFDKVTIKMNEKQNKVRYGDVFFTTSSETPEEVGISSVYLGDDLELYLNSFCFGFRINNLTYLSPEFAAYYFRGRAFRDILNKLAQGATRFNLSKKKLIEKYIKIPTFDEQNKISEILIHIEKECNMFEKELYIQKEKKKALMQLLLTGKVRVKV